MNGRGSEVLPRLAKIQAGVLCDAKISQGKGIQDNDKTGADVWSIGLDSDKYRRISTE